MSNPIKVSDLIIKRLIKLGIRDVFCVTGGASAHLLESVRATGINVIHNYHEQACAMAADSYARVTNKPALVLITNGPGVSNAITGVIGAFQDSIPMIIISGQVPVKHSIDANEYNLRQLGIQELATSKLVKNFVKNFVQLRDASKTKEVIDQLWKTATTGRKGPVWLEVPLDVQADYCQDYDSQSNKKESINYVSNINGLENELKTITDKIQESKKPIIVIGSGIRLSNSVEIVKKLVNLLHIPVVSTWNASDVFRFDHASYVGNFGILGQRPANLAVQNADLLIILGSRMSIPNIGHSTELFSPQSYKIMVDIDESELLKNTLKIDLGLNLDLYDFIEKFLNQLRNISYFNYSERFKKWTEIISQWKVKYLDIDEDKSEEINCINAYSFIKILSRFLPLNSIVVTDMGISFTCTMQSLKNNGNNRLFTASGMSSMGYGLPAAIGAAVASPSKQIICIVGDGGLQMNIQEIQTLVQYNLPIKLFILDSNGYLAISVMQEHLFGGNYFGSTPDSGVSSPNFVKIFESYGLSASSISSESELTEFLERGCLEAKDFAMYNLTIPKSQIMSPRVKSKKDPSGKITAGAIDKMWPFLSEIEEHEIQDQVKF
jgi:acetolactate synthase-1/2/3 large subunit